MKFDATSHLVEGMEFRRSPNFDERPMEMEPEVIIIHAISLPPGCYRGDYISALFCNELDHSEHHSFEGLKDLFVSAHFLIRRDGSAIQFVPVDKRAWHAGVSICLGRKHVNDFSIGIELEGCDDEPFEQEQYVTLQSLIASLKSQYPKINSKRIFGHCEIAPQRKTDPGPYFDWSKVR